MRNFHPASWSEQARRMCDNEIISVNAGWGTIEGACDLFSRSYRHPLIRGRAAKRFGRKVRSGKVHENLELYYSHFPTERSE